jgi:pimeloyl-ACP methyl ester carboxylesterase
MPDRAATAAAFRAAYDAMLRLWTATPESRDVVTPGARTRVQVWGDPSAPPLVLLHGFQVTSTMWAPNAAAFGAVRRVYAPDTLGDFGFSTATNAAAPRSLDALLAWLEALLDALGLDAVDLGGMSYGGWLSAHFAARHPARVRRLVLLAPGASFGSFSAAFVLRGLPMIALPRRRFVDSYLRWAAVPPAGDARYEAVMSALVDVMHTGIRHFGGLRLPLPKRLPPDVMRAIAAPTLLVYGAQERMYSSARAVEVARRHLPNLEHVILPDASHDLTLQGTRVNDCVSRFLAHHA